MPESLAYDIYEYQKQENRTTYVASIAFGDNANASVNHPLKSTISLLMNPTNNVTVRLTPVSSKILQNENNNLKQEMPIQKKDMPRTIYDIYENIQEIPKVRINKRHY